MTDTDMLYMASLEKRNAELEARVAELEEKHWNECRQIAHYSDELKDLQEENRVLMQECDRLIKEKGELLSKVSGGQPVKHGEWDFQGYQLFKCTNCNEIFTQNQLEAMQNHINQEEFTFPNFCPNCGVDMRGDTNE